MNKAETIFFELLRAGLWERPARLADFDPIDWNQVYDIAKKQTVVGLLAAGLGHLDDYKVKKASVMPFITDVGSVVENNRQMNDLIASLVPQLTKEGISAVLVKGQGIAQCYDRPLWRSCGDVDLLLDAADYEKTKLFLSSKADKVEKEEPTNKHLAMRIGSFEVELHGTLRSLRNPKVDRTLDRMIDRMFAERQFRIWNNNAVEVSLPAPDNDVIIIFTHILQHFFVGGIGIRQVCDWCRILWSFRDVIDIDMLEGHLNEMKVMTEWKAFGCVAVDYLGLPFEAMPFYDASFKKKADRIVTHILYVGNFGHNRDHSYFRKYPYLIRKAISFSRQAGDSWRHISIFPIDALRYFYHSFFYSTKAVMRGE